MILRLDLWIGWCAIALVFGGLVRIGGLLMMLLLQWLGVEPA